MSTEDGSSTFTEEMLAELYSKQKVPVRMPAAPSSHRAQKGIDKRIVLPELDESCTKFLAKGRRVQIENRLRTRRWTDSNNLSRETTEIVAQRIQFLDSKKAA